MIYSGLYISGWPSSGWRVLAIPVAILGVFSVGYSISIILGAVTGLVTIGIFGSIVCFALFKIGE